MSELPPRDRFGLDTPAAKQTASNLDAYRRQVIEERWLSTLILSGHLEIEAALQALIHQHRLAQGKTPCRSLNSDDFVIHSSITMSMLQLTSLALVYPA